MTFAGESMRLDWANAITGTITADGDPMRYRAGSDTLAAGSSFIAGFYDYTLVTADDDVQASVVLVLGSATAGSVRASYGVDPDFTLDDPSVATQPLGTHAVTGETELVLPVTSFDLSGLLAYDHEQAVFVEVLTGSVEFAQVKIRLWPPGGISGAWVPGETLSVESALNRWAASNAASGFSTSGYEAAYTAAAALYSTETVQQVDVNPLTVSVSGDIGEGIPPATPTDPYTYGVTVEAASVWIFPDLLGQPAGAGTITHPDEVSGEPGSRNRNPDGSPATYQFDTWTHDTIDVQSQVQLGTPPYNGSVSVVGGVPAPDTEIVSFSPFRRDFTPPVTPEPVTAVAYATGDYQVSLPSDPQLLVSVSSWTWATRSAGLVTGTSGNLAAAGQVTVTFPSGFRANLVVSGYLVWNPEASPEVPMRQRQRRDGLGMGAPAIRVGGSRQGSTRIRGHY